jgi:phosphomevalonate kinase
VSVARHVLAEASAPGKAFVFGELAALEGGPALVAAVERRVIVKVVDAEARAAAGNTEPPAWIERLDGGPARTLLRAALLAYDAEGDLLVAVARALADAGVPLPERLAVASSRDGLVDADGRSLGLGSSAASAVALVAALAPELAPERREALAVEAHRAFQGGHGSGYDVVASHRGGLSLLERDGEGEGEGVRISARRVELHGWALLFANGRVEVATPGVVRAVVQAVGRDRRAREALDRLRALSERGGREALAGRIDAVPPLMRAFMEAEATLGEVAGVALVTAEVRRLDRELTALGGACKPSGAGGDELLVALVPAAAREEACELMARRGYDVVQAALAREGLRLLRP